MGRLPPGETPTQTVERLKAIGHDTGTAVKMAGEYHRSSGVSVPSPSPSPGSPSPGSPSPGSPSPPSNLPSGATPSNQSYLREWQSVFDKNPDALNIPDIYDGRYLSPSWSKEEHQTMALRKQLEQAGVPGQEAVMIASRVTGGAKMPEAGGHIPGYLNYGSMPESRLATQTSGGDFEGIGWAYLDRYGMPHVVRDLGTALTHSVDGQVFPYEGSFGRGYALDQQGQRAMLDLPGARPYGNIDRQLEYYNRQDEGGLSGPQGSANLDQSALIEALVMAGIDPSVAQNAYRGGTMSPAVAPQAPPGWTQVGHYNPEADGLQKQSAPTGGQTPTKHDTPIPDDSKTAGQVFDEKFGLGALLRSQEGSDVGDYTTRGIEALYSMVNPMAGSGIGDAYGGMQTLQAKDQDHRHTIDWERLGLDKDRFGLDQFAQIAKYTMGSWGERAQLIQFVVNNWGLPEDEAETLVDDWMGGGY